MRYVEIQFSLTRFTSKICIKCVLINLYRKYIGQNCSREKRCVYQVTNNSDKRIALREVKHSETGGQVVCKSKFSRCWQK